MRPVTLESKTTHIKFPMAQQPSVKSVKFRVSDNKIQDDHDTTHIDEKREQYNITPRSNLPIVLRKAL